MRCWRVLCGLRALFPATGLPRAVQTRGANRSVQRGLDAAGNDIHSRADSLAYRSPPPLLSSSSSLPPPPDRPRQLFPSLHLYDHVYGDEACACLRQRLRRAWDRHVLVARGVLKGTQRVVVLNLQRCISCRLAHGATPAGGGRERSTATRHVAMPRVRRVPAQT